MANFGVNLEEVWHMSSLLPPQQTTSKHSKYEVDVGSRGGDNNNNNNNSRSVNRGGEYGSGHQQNTYQPTAVIPDSFIPISNPQVPPRRLVETMDMPSPPGNNNNGQSPPAAPGQAGPPPLPDFVIEYQKEIQYLRALATTLKKELSQKQQKDQAADRKKQLKNMFLIIGFAILLIIIIILLSQVIQKMNRLISQPMLFNV